MPEVTKALYYPHIHFRSLDWLKCALLYWDGIKRIVPHRGFRTQDSRPVQALREEGLVEDVSAETYRTAATDAFLPRLQELTRSREGAFVGAPQRIGRAVREHRNDENALVHTAKMDHRLMNALHTSGLGRRAGDWFQMSQEIAGLYMMRLAGVAARSLNTPVVSDAPEYEVASLYFNAPESTFQPPRAGMALARLLCPFPRPRSMREVPLKRVLQIRERHAAERRAFRRKVDEIAKDLKSAASKEAVRDAIEAHKKEISESLRAQKAALSASRIGTTWDLMSLSAPGWVAPGLAALGAGSVTVAVGAGIAFTFGALNWFVQRAERGRAARDSCPWHYLVTLRRKPRAERSGGSLLQGLNELVYD